VRDLTDELKAERTRLSELASALDIEGKRARLAELEKSASDPGLWDDPDAARSVTTEMSRVKDDIDLVDGLDGRLSDTELLFEMGRDESDDSVGPELAVALAGLVSDLDALELRSLYTGEHDEGDAVCEVHSGAGGTDSQDWAEMLLRMYQRWAERRGFEVELDEISAGAEAGITSATFIVRGRYAYGLLSSEKGVHRLVRISPFASTPTGRRVPAASTSTSPTRRCASPTCPAASSCRARTSAASIRTRPWPCRSSRPSWPSGPARSGARSSMPCPASSGK